MPYGLSGKTIFITGASSGLGAHFARVFARQNSNVVLAARRTDRLAELERQIASDKVQTLSLALDVTDASAIEDAVAQAVNRFGRIDVLINNAGLTQTKPALEHDSADLDNIIDVNLRGNFLMAKAVGARMAQSGGGSIINIASILGLRQAGQVSSYAISKAGVIQMTKVLALEWARYGIRVNALAPGYIHTDLNSEFWETDAGKALIKRIPQRRLGRPEELDGPLLLLASDYASYMTGSVLEVDGGHLVSTL